MKINDISIIAQAVYDVKYRGLKSPMIKDIFVLDAMMRVTHYDMIISGRLYNVYLKFKKYNDVQVELLTTATTNLLLESGYSKKDAADWLNGLSADDIDDDETEMARSIIETIQSVYEGHNVIITYPDGDTQVVDGNIVVLADTIRCPECQNIFYIPIGQDSPDIRCPYCSTSVRSDYYPLLGG